ncbi:MAG TPA: hypothetical protein VNF28_04495 [Candidatus Binataceae bacterium]|nr:hypothetical protein [Candidatus Binataceae bacterium]
MGLALHELEPKVKLVWWTPHAFLFQIRLPGASANATAGFLTDAITIQNIGRRSAERVEIVCATKPDLFKLQPPLDYQESNTPAGEHVIRIDSLGPKEFFTIEFLSYTSAVQVQIIRSSAGQAQAIPIQFNRVFPRWFNRVALVALLTGFGFWIYWLLRICEFRSRDLTFAASFMPSPTSSVGEG